MTTRLRSIAPLAPLLPLYVLMSVWFPRRPSDERNYLVLAQNLLDGQFTGLGWRPAEPFASPDPSNPDLWFGPGLPLLLTPLVGLDLPVEVVRLVGPVCLFLAVVVFQELLRLYVGRREAMLGALALGLYVPFYVLLPNLHSEPPAILFLVTMLYGLARFARSGGYPSAILAAGAAAGLALTRVAFGWVVTAMIVACLLAWLVSRRRAWLRFAAVYALALALCAPWLLYTHSVTERFFLWGNSGSLSLYWMSSPYRQDLGDWRGGAREIVVSDPRLVHHREFFREIGRLDPMEQNRRLERRALENIRGDPLKFARNVTANTSRMLFGFPFSDKRETLKTLYYLLPNSVILWAAAGALVVLVRRRVALPVEGVAFLLFGGLAFGLHSVLAAYPRMLAPLVPILLWFVVFAFGRRRAATPVARG